MDQYEVKIFDSQGKEVRELGKVGSKRETDTHIKNIRGSASIQILGPQCRIEVSPKVTLKENYLPAGVQVNVKHSSTRSESQRGIKQPSG